MTFCSIGAVFSFNGNAVFAILAFYRDTIVAVDTNTIFAIGPVNTDFTIDAIPAIGAFLAHSHVVRQRKVIGDLSSRGRLGNLQVAITAVFRAINCDFNRFAIPGIRTYKLCHFL